MPWITPVQDTKLLMRPLPSSALPINEWTDRPMLKPDKSPNTLGIISAKKQGNFWKVLMAGDLTIGGVKTRTCYLWPAHWRGVQEVFAAALDADRAKAIAAPSKPKSKVQLPVKYRSQMDNTNNPTGSCNVTSAAMVMAYYGVQDLGKQLEDELYESLERQGLSRHDPNHLKVIIEQRGKNYSLKDHFTSSASLAQIKQALANGIPVIVHGYFTAFGHIIVLIGYDDQGFICHDPYGVYGAGHGGSYDLNNDQNPRKGEAVHYSYGQIEYTCFPDGYCWAHFITGKKQDILTTPPKQFRIFQPHELRLNSHAVKLIKHFEGLELNQYYCSAEVSTIGIGTTRWWGGGEVPLGAQITQDQAVELFARDCAEFIAQIKQLLIVPVTARQFAAVLSFAYNCGTEALRTSTLLNVINGSGDAVMVRGQLMRWTKADGRELAGLVRRREAESKLWENRDDWMD